MVAAADEQQLLLLPFLVVLLAVSLCLTLRQSPVSPHGNPHYRRIPLALAPRRQRRRSLTSLSVSVLFCVTAWTCQGTAVCWAATPEDFGGYTHSSATWESEDEVPEHPTPSLLWNEPFLIICSMDGSIGVLRALDGTVVGGFTSGSPLQTRSHVLRSGKQIIPGFDGSLYIKDEDGTIHPLHLTVVDLLHTPSMTTCNGDESDQEDCGFITATKSTTLFGLNAHSGKLAWRQSPDGTTTTVRDDDSESPTSSTVLLQRVDILIQQVSQISGRSVWNATVGMVEAMNFQGTAQHHSHHSDTTNANSARKYLPGGTAPSTPTSSPNGGHVLLQEYELELPSLIFSADSTTLSAVSSQGRTLWRRSFPTMVVAVFGLQDQSWKDVRVVEEQEVDEQSNTPPTANPPISLHGLMTYQPLVFPYWARQKHPLLDRHSTDWLFSRPPQQLDSRKDQTGAASSHTSDSNLLPTGQTHKEKFNVPKRLALPAPSHEMSSSSLGSSTVHDESKSYKTQHGIYLTWPVALFISLATLTILAVGGRYIYVKKKTKWLSLADLIKAASSVGKEEDKGTVVLKRSYSLPDVRSQPIRRRVRSDSMRSPRTGDEASFFLRPAKSTDSAAIRQPMREANKSMDSVAVKQVRETNPTTEPLSTTNEAETIDASAVQQGVGFLVDGIPLIRYNRYESEFSEVASLGRGGFGSVFRCRNVLDGREYAIKKVALRYNSHLPQAEFRQRLQRTLREVKSLALLDHPNIVRYYTAWLELEQDTTNKSKDTDGDTSRAAVESDYLLFSSAPTTTANHTRTNGFSLVQTSTVQESRRPHRNDNPLGAWTNSDFGYGEEESLGNYVPGIPAALDDYGFTFDRNSEQSTSSTANGKTTPTGGAANDQGHKDCRKLAGYGFEPSIQDSAAMAKGTDSCNQMNGNVSQYETEHQVTKQSNRAPGPSYTVKHILYIQMQFCSQETLASFLTNAEARKRDCSSVDIPYALNLFLQIARGVHHVHSHGLIHRDLKPNNCFIDDSGVVKVGDFGLSRESSGPETLREVDGNGSEEGKGQDSPAVDGDITAGVGTRSYASPEQMEGSDYDSSTDVYSLGVILFELCYPMYTGMERNIVLSKLRHSNFPDSWMESVQPSFPVLHSLLLSMLSKSPADRPSAEIVVRKIQTILEGFTITSLGKHHEASSILLRIEAKPREDVLKYTIDRIKEAALPELVEIAQYGLRGGTNKAIMEFAISSPCPDHATLGNDLVTRLTECEDILLIRQVFAANNS